MFVNVNINVYSQMSKYIYFNLHRYNSVFFIINYNITQVNLGVVEANPSSTAGTCEILDSLLGHVPSRQLPEGNRLITVPCHGDGLTVDRIAKAKKARTNHPDALFRYEGFEPVPQDFHKEMLLMQVGISVRFKLIQCATKFAVNCVQNSLAV